MIDPIIPAMISNRQDHWECVREWLESDVSEENRFRLSLYSLMACPTSRRVELLNLAPDAPPSTPLMKTVSQNAESWAAMNTRQVLKVYLKAIWEQLEEEDRGKFTKWAETQAPTAIAAE